MKNKLTIIVQTYNRELGLRRNLESLENQDDMNFDLLIFDNGANYNVWNILSDFPKLSELARVVRAKENKGLVFGRNDSVKHVNTEYFGRIDDDDFATKDYVKTINRLINENYDLILVSAKNSCCETGKRQVFSWEPWRYIIKTKNFIEYPNILPEDFLSVFYYLSNSSKVSFDDVKIYLGDPTIFAKDHVFSENYSLFAFHWIDKINENRNSFDFGISIINRPKWMSKKIKNYSDLRAFCFYDELNHIRNWYDAAKTKNDRKKLIRRYREIKCEVKPRLFSRIIWSQIYVVFSFRFIRNR